MVEAGLNFAFSCDEIIDNDQIRLDKAVSLYFSNKSDLEELSRSRASRLIKSGLVKVDGEVSKKPSKLVGSISQIELVIPAEEETYLLPDPSVEFEIVDESGAFLVINKPAGLVVHPGAGNKSGTLANGLVHYFGKNKVTAGGDLLRPGIVHRLDKNTSGLMIISKSDSSFQNLQKQFLPPRTVKRSYLALTRKLPDNHHSSNTIDAPIARDPNNRLRMAVLNNGKPAVTHWNVRRELKKGYLLEIVLETGRTHQIRVHFTAFGAPIVGDLVYGEPIGSLPGEVQKITKDFNRQALHAEKLSFLNPGDGEAVSFTSTPDKRMLSLIEAYDK